MSFGFETLARSHLHFRLTVTSLRRSFVCVDLLLLCHTLSPMLDDTEMDAPGSAKAWHDLPGAEETWQAVEFEPCRRHDDELDENEQVAVFMLEMDPRCLVASAGV